MHDSYCLQTRKVPESKEKKIRNTLNLCKLPIFSVTSASIDTKSFLCFPFSFLSCRSISTKVVYCRMRDFSFTCKTVIFLLFSESIFFISFESIWRALSKFCTRSQWRYQVTLVILICTWQKDAQSGAYIILLYFHSILLDLILKFPLLLFYCLSFCFPSLLFTIVSCNSN